MDKINRIKKRHKDLLVSCMLLLKVIVGVVIYASSFLRCQPTSLSALF